MKRPYAPAPWDWRHYQTDRRSGLPRGYFDEARADWYVVVVCIVALVVGLAVTM